MHSGRVELFWLILQIVLGIFQFVVLLVLILIIEIAGAITAYVYKGKVGFITVAHLIFLFSLQ